MTPGRIDAMIGALVAVLMLAAVGSWIASGPPVDPERAQSLASPSLPTPATISALNRSAGQIVANNPFRLSRRPASVRYARYVTPVAQSEDAPPRLRPRLVLKGIVGGPPWQAIIDGLPGAPPGTVVSVGNSFQSLTISAIARDAVMVQGADTTWRLTLSK